MRQQQFKACGQGLKLMLDKEKKKEEKKKRTYPGRESSPHGSVPIFTGTLASSGVFPLHSIVVMKSVEDGRLSTRVWCGTP